MAVLRSISGQDAADFANLPPAQLAGVFTVFGVIHRKASAGSAGVAIGLGVFAAIIPAPPTGARAYAQSTAA